MMLVVALLGSLAGLAAGEISRTLADRHRKTLHPDRLSWLLAGGGALALTAHPAGRGDLATLLAGLAVIGVLLLVLACDARERAVYPAIVYPGVALAAATAPLFGSTVADSLFGAAASALVFLVLYLVAFLRYGPGAFGGGDVTAALLLGAVVGFPRLSMALPLAGIIGAAIAVVVGLRAGSRRASFAYAPALCLAALVATIL